MAEVEWIKVSTGMFETSRKIKQIELMKNGDGILVIWLKLLLLAGNINDGGAIYITEDKPYDITSLAGELRRPVALVKQALDVFEGYGMIENDGGIIYLTSWEKYQSAEKLDVIREQNRMRKRRQRERQSRDSHVTSHESVTLGHATEEEEEGELEKDPPPSSLNARAGEDDLRKERMRSKYLGGTLGGGVVMISAEQFDRLCETLTLDEIERYFRVVRDCENSGKHYGKSHYKAIMDMAKEDRRL